MKSRTAEAWNGTTGKFIMTCIGDILSSFLIEIHPNVAFNSVIYIYNYVKLLHIYQEMPYYGQTVSEKS